MRCRVGPTRYQRKRNRREGVRCRNFATLEPFARKDSSLDEARRSFDLQIPRRRRQTEATVRPRAPRLFLSTSVCLSLPRGLLQRTSTRLCLAFCKGLRQDLMTFIIRWGGGGGGGGEGLGF